MVKTPPNFTSCQVCIVLKRVLTKSKHVKIAKNWSDLDRVLKSPYFIRVLRTLIIAGRWQKGLVFIPIPMTEPHPPTADTRVGLQASFVDSGTIQVGTQRRRRPQRPKRSTKDEDAIPLIQRRRRNQRWRSNSITTWVEIPKSYRTNQAARNVLASRSARI